MSCLGATGRGSDILVPLGIQQGVEVGVLKVAKDDLRKGQRATEAKGDRKAGVSGVADTMRARVE